MLDGIVNKNIPQIVKAYYGVDKIMLSVDQLTYCASDQYLNYIGMSDAYYSSFTWRGRKVNIDEKDKLFGCNGGSWNGALLAIGNLWENSIEGLTIDSKF